MPIVDLDPRPLNAPLGREKPGYVTPGIEDIGEAKTLDQVSSATARLENSVVSAAVSNQWGAVRQDDPEFKPWDEIKDTKYEPNWQSFVNVRNRSQLQATMRDIDRETEDRKTVEAAPWYMTLPASLLANVTDPTILFPGGAFVRGAKGGFSVARSAIAGGAATAGGVAVQDVLLHGSQQTRTFGEDVADIGSSVLLGGVLSGAGAALLTRAETRAAIAGLDRDSARAATGAARQAIHEDVVQQLRAAGRPEDEAQAAAAVMAARYTARAQRLGTGESALDLYRSEGLSVRRGEAPPPRGVNKAIYDRVVAIEEAEKAQKAQRNNTASVTPPENVPRQGEDFANDNASTKPEAAPPAAETITSAATRFRGEVYPTIIHAMAAEQIVKKFGLSEAELGKALHSGEYADGYITSSGRFLTRTEALAIAEGGDIGHGPDSVGTVLKTESAAKAGEAPTPEPVKPPENTLRIATQTTADGVTTYKAISGSEEIASARLRINPAEGSAAVTLAEVRESFRRQGVASRLYDRIEQDAAAKGLKLRPDDLLSNDAYAFWKARNPEAIVGYLPTADGRNWQPSMGLIVKRALDARDRAAEVERAPTPPKPEVSPPEPQAEPAPLAEAVPPKSKAGPAANPEGELQSLRAEARAAHDAKEWALENELAGREVQLAFPEARILTGDQFELPIVAADGSEIGNVLFYLTPDRVQIRSSRIEPASQRQGYGAGAYRRLIDYAIASGREFSSGADTSAAAKALYRSLGREYHVQKRGLDGADGFTISAGGGGARVAPPPPKPQTGPAAKPAVVGYLPTAEIDERAPAAPTPAASAREPGLLQEGTEGPRGRITLDDGAAVVELFKTADRSTFVHEMGHKWLDELAHDAGRESVPQALKDDLGTVLRWLSVDKAEDIGRAQHEQWARGFEQYLAEGKAPSSALARAFEQFKQWLKEIYRSLTRLGEPISDDIRGVMDRMLATDGEIAARDRPIGPGNDPYAGSIGAAAVGSQTNAQTAIAGNVAGALAKLKINPSLRLSDSLSSVARDVARNLFEMSQYTRGNEAGIPTPQAAETLRKEWEGGLMNAVQATNKVYSDYRKAGGTLKWEPFKEEVGRAMRREDKSDIPEVAKAAQSWRKDVFEPLKEAAIKAKLLPEDVSVETAASYFSRLWNREQLVAEEGEFKDVVTKYYGGAIANAYEKARVAHIERIARYEQEVADLQLSGPERAALLERLPAELKAMREANQPFEETSRSVGEFHSQAFKAREAGKPEDAAALLTRAKAISDAAGQRYADYISDRNTMASRLRRVRNNIEGRGDQVAAIRNRIADAEAANFDRLWRMHRSIALLEEEVERGSPESWAGKISELRTEFAKILERSNKDQDRLAAAKEKKLAAGQEAMEQGKVDKAAEIERELGRGDPFVQEAKRIAEMNKLAEHIGDLEKVDPEATLKELRSLIEKRLSQTAEMVEYEGQRMATLAKRAEQADPKLLAERIGALAAKRAETERAFFDRWEVRNLGQNVDPASAARPNFTDAARGIADEAFNALTGRNSEGVRPEFLTITSRGPMKDRTFNIPDEVIERWLHSDVEMVGRRYSRIMSADVELANKFGTPDMKEALATVTADYAKLRAAAIANGNDPNVLAALTKQEKANLEDLRGVRDVIRETIGQSSFDQNYGHILRKARAVEYILKMGQVVLSSLTEPVRTVAMKGLFPFMRDGMAALSNLPAARLQVAEARLAGNINDKLLSARLSSLADISDFYGSRGPVEKFLDNATNVASTWNGIRAWTDFGKMMASNIIQNNLLKWTSGFAGIGAKERRYLAFVGIDESMAGRIAKEFGAHGQNANGVYVAGTAEWTDDVARRTYRAALNKDLDSAVVTRGAGDLPLFANTGIGKILFQFNTFNLASHQRILLRGLQEGHARFLGTVAALSSIGMLQVYLTAVATNSVNKLPNPAQNPGWWISEGLDKSGIFQVPMQMANAVELFTGVNPIKAPIKLGDEGRQQSQKLRNRNPGSLLGPTASSLNDIATVGKVPFSWARGESATKAEANAAERLLPFNSYLGVRQFMKYFINPPAE